MKRPDYTCEHCGGTFPEDPDWSEADALMEYQDLWTAKQRANAEMPVKVCHDCFEVLLQQAQRIGLCPTK